MKKLYKYMILLVTLLFIINYGFSEQLSCIKADSMANGYSNYFYSTQDVVINAGTLATYDGEEIILVNTTNGNKKIKYGDYESITFNPDNESIICYLPSINSHSRAYGIVLVRFVEIGKYGLQRLSSTSGINNAVQGLDQLKQKVESENISNANSTLNENACSDSIPCSSGFDCVEGSCIVSIPLVSLNYCEQVSVTSGELSSHWDLVEKNQILGSPGDYKNYENLYNIKYDMALNQNDITILDNSNNIICSQILSVSNINKQFKFKVNDQERLIDYTYYGGFNYDIYKPNENAIIDDLLSVPEELLDVDSEDIINDKVDSDYVVETETGDSQYRCKQVDIPKDLDKYWEAIDLGILADHQIIRYVFDKSYNSETKGYFVQYSIINEARFLSLYDDKDDDYPKPENFFCAEELPEKGAILYTIMNDQERLFVHEKESSDQEKDSLQFGIYKKKSKTNDSSKQDLCESLDGVQSEDNDGDGLGNECDVVPSEPGSIANKGAPTSDSILLDNKNVTNQENINQANSQDADVEEGHCSSQKPNCGENYSIAKKPLQNVKCVWLKQDELKCPAGFKTSYQDTKNSTGPFDFLDSFEVDAGYKIEKTEKGIKINNVTTKANANAPKISDVYEICPETEYVVGTNALFYNYFNKVIDYPEPKDHRFLVFNNDKSKFVICVPEGSYAEDTLKKINAELDEETKENYWYWATRLLGLGFDVKVG